MTKKGNKKICIGIFIILLICLCIGSFYDYQISSAVFNSNSKIGILLASYGQLPAMLSLATGGTLMIRIADKNKRITFVLAIIGGALLNILAIMGITMDPLLYMKSMPWFVSLLIAITLVIIADLFVCQLSNDADKGNMKRLAMLLITAVFAELILINIVKIPWGRPRMRLIAVNSEAVFQPWWVIGSTMKEHLTAMGVAAEEFKSFPSGHSGNAACAILFSVFPLVFPKLKGKGKSFFIGGLIFAILVAVSRIVMGAHFLSDVTIGISISFVIIFLLYGYLWRDQIVK